MAKRKFRLKLANLGEGKRWTSIDFRSYMIWNEGLSDPIIREGCGDDIAYGPLFAYLFRRFGYPLYGWDDYKQLCTYYLTTPHPDMLLNITPYVGNTSVIAIRFMVPRAVMMQIEDYARRDRSAWDQRMYAWAEQQGLPDWMPEWVAFYNNECRQLWPAAPASESWRDIMSFPFPYGEPGTPLHDMTSRVVQYGKQLREDYEKVEAWPAYYERPADWRAMNDDDPLKPFAEAALVALQDLRTPVGVRDQSIDAFGAADDGVADVPAAPSAGYPCGALGNAAPKEFAELHGLVVQLGKGNVKRGIKKIMAALKTPEPKEEVTC